MPDATSVADPSTIGTIDRWWRAANYVAAVQIYLRDNVLLREPLRPEHIKPRLLGHWGTTPGLTFVWAHLNHQIRKRGVDMLNITGPGHGGPAITAATWLEGRWSEVYPDDSLDEQGLTRLARRFSTPYGIPSHVAPEVPGSIHEGGELGYSLAHAFGAAFDNPDLTATCVIGDGEAETGPLAAAWHGTKFLNPVHDGAVLPILHLNGWKIANPTVLARIEPDELRSLMLGYGWEPLVVSGSDPTDVHQQMMAALDTALDQIDDIQARARSNGNTARPRWPMICLRTPKGWTGPKATAEGLPIEDHWRSHQVPLAAAADDPDQLLALEQWLRSYGPDDLFDERGQPVAVIRDAAPSGLKRMSANPHTNGGHLTKPLLLPDHRANAVDVPLPGSVDAEATRALGAWLTEVMAANIPHRNFRLFGPDETASNRLHGVYDVTAKTWNASTIAEDDNLAPDGRVMEILSEHTCQGWLEGYLLTGRHGFFSTYEAFAHIIGSMFNQHAKWLKVTSQHLGWRAPIPSLNYLLTSHTWRQDHNGFSHQDPGFIDHVVNKNGANVGVYLPPDANTLLHVGAKVLASRDMVNLVIAGKQPSPQWLDIDAAEAHVQRGFGIWPWAGNDSDGEPALVMASCGDVVTVESLAATELLRELFPELRVRVVNVVDLMVFQTPEEHPHGIDDEEFVRTFTAEAPIVLAFHGYPWLIHRLAYRRPNHRNLHVRGYKEEGSTTTPFDMVVRNQVDRFSLAIDAIERLPQLGSAGVHARQELADRLVTHRRAVRATGQDLPEITSWRWRSASPAAS